MELLSETKSVNISCEEKKTIEKIVAGQLTAYLDRNGLLPPCQSGFRRFHSTETLLLRLLSDIYGAIDRADLTLLALFDVSVAFDTVDHTILLKRLNVTFGLSGSFLRWIGSFLHERILLVWSMARRGLGGYPLRTVCHRALC